jgi:superfamily I DNA and/or RNA helicase
MKIIIAILSIMLTGCLHINLPAPVVEVTNSCYVPKPFPKPKLPVINYVVQGIDDCTYYLCLTENEADNANKRETLLIEYANTITEQYIDIMEECNSAEDNGTNEN